jgi:Carboxypeptidase regulatory-like domain
MTPALKGDGLHAAGLLVLLSFAVSVLPAGAEGTPVSLDELVAGLERFDASGLVVDGEGQPIEDAEVFCYYMKGRCGVRDRFVGTTKTNRKGGFKFKKDLYWEPPLGDENEGTGTYAFIVKHSDRGMNFRTLKEGDDPDGIRIPLGRPHFRDLTVQNAEGEPMEGALVFLHGGEISGFEQAAERMGPSPIQLRMQDMGLGSGTTDAAGQVRLMAFEGATTFRAVKGGFVHDMRPRGDKDRDTIVLYPSARVSGTARFEDGTPAAGMAVYFTYTDDLRPNSQVALTDKSGRFAFENVAGAGFPYAWMFGNTLRAAAGNPHLQPVDLRPDSPFKALGDYFQLRPGEDLQKELVLTRGIRLGGVVRDLDTGEPAPYVRFSLRWRLPASVPQGGQGVETDEDGRWSVMAPPNVMIQCDWREVGDGGCCIDQDWLQQGNCRPYSGLVGGDKTDFEFKVKLRRLVEWGGRVVDAEGRGVEGAKVYLASSLARTETDASGAFTLREMSADLAYDVLAVSKAGDLAGVVHSKAGATPAEIRLAPVRSCDGLVKNTEGLPAAGLKFALLPDLNGSRLGSNVGAQLETDEAGRFHVDGLFPGVVYRAMWSWRHDWNAGYDCGNVPIDVATLDAGALITFEAAEFPRRVDGTVVNAAGAPMAGASVRVARGGTAPHSGVDSFVADEAGRFTLPHVAAGPFLVRVSAERCKSRIVEVPRDSAVLHVVLPPVSEGAIYRVRVVDEGGAPMPDAPVRLHWDLSQDAPGVPKDSVESTNEEGVVEFAFAPEDDALVGEGAVWCDVPGRDLAAAGITLNQDAYITLTLRKPGEHKVGRFLGPGDEPVPGAEVRVIKTSRKNRTPFEPGACFGDASDWVFHTGPDGVFEMPRFSKDYCVIARLSAEGYEPVAWAGLWSDDAGVRVFRTGLCDAVKGTVAMEGLAGGTPEVQVFACDSAGRNRGYATTDEQGRFFIRHMDPGLYRLEARTVAPEFWNYVCTSTPVVEVTAKEPATVALTFAEAAPVDGLMVGGPAGVPRVGAAKLPGSELKRGGMVGDNWLEAKGD